jgi:hypothetical protein
MCSFLKKYHSIKSIISFILIISISLDGCASTSGASSTPTSQAQQQQQQEVVEIVTITSVILVFTTVLCIFVASANAKKDKAKAKAEEDKFQACVGKTKAEIYSIYGPPDSIVDDGLNDGGNILIYRTVSTTGDSDNGYSTITYRKLFYLNKDNVVTSVKEDSK